MLSDSNIRERLGPIADPAQDPNQSPRTRPAGLIAGLVVLVVVLWVAGVAFLFHLEKISPAVYDARTGHIYRFSDKLHTVYFTPNERYAAWSALAIPALSTIAVAFFAFRKPAALKVEG
jgi:hypothetical protein